MKKANLNTELWQSFQNGDRAAFAEIYSQHIEALLSYGCRITSNRQLIKDSIQDLFLHLWLHKENLSETDSIKFYLFRALRNRIIKNRVLEERFLTDSDLISEEHLIELPFEYTLTTCETSQQQTNRLQSAIKQLSPRQQEVIIFRYHHDFSLSEISDLMKLSNQSVRNLLHRAVSQIRSFFELAGWLWVFIFDFLK